MAKKAQKSVKKPERQSEWFLKPVALKSRIPKIATFDIESHDWINFKMLGFYDGTQYLTFGSMEAFLVHVLKKKYRGFWIYAHNGGKFDFQFILDVLLMRKKRYQYETIQAGSRILALKIKINRKNNITFVDSIGQFMAGLDKLTTSFKVKHQKMKGTIDFDAGEKFETDNPLHMEYLRHDVLGLYEVMKAYTRDPMIMRTGLKLTTASQSMAIWRTTIKSPIRVTTQIEQDFCRKSYVGGRCEIFKKDGENLSEYDVNSLYPSCLRNYPIPVECQGQAADFTDFGFHDVTVKAPDIYIPILPLKIDKKLIFPTGTFRGVYFSEELKLAVEHGYRIVKYHDGLAFSHSNDLFSEYIDYFYEKRKRAVKDSSEDLLAKLFLNSLYGKFGQKEQRRYMKIEDGSEEPDSITAFISEDWYNQTGMINVTEEHRSPFMLSHIAAATTAWGRIHMNRNYYQVNPESHFYTDTDSIFTSSKLATGDKLGQLKLENEDLHAHFRMPKGYIVFMKDKTVITRKMKGYPKKFLNGGMINGKKFKPVSIKEFKESNLFYENKIFATAKTSLIRNRRFLSMVEISKTLVSEYSKRRVLKNGDTVPWIIKNGELK